MNLAMEMETDDHPLVYYRSAGSLQSIASAKIATVLWHRRIHNAVPEKALSEHWLRNEELDINDFPPVPKIIGEEICKSFKQFGSRLIHWLKEGCCLDIYIHIPRKCIDIIDFSDSKKTAKKLIDSDHFTAGQKYLIACKCGFRDDIERLWPLVSPEDMPSITSNKPVLIPIWVYYWNCRMMGIPPEHIRGNPNHSIEARVLDHGSSRDEFNFWIIRNWPTVEYFWNSLNANERLSLMATVVHCLKPADIVQFLPTLNDAEIHQLLEANIAFIVGTLGTHPDRSDYAVQVWNHYCKFATEIQVYEGLKEVFEFAFCSDLVDSDQAFHVSAALNELWIHTPDALKTVVLRVESIEAFFNQLISRDEKIFDDDDDEYDSSEDAFFYIRNLDFLLNILRSVDLPRREYIWRRSWRSLVFMARPLCLEQFLKLCFKNDRDIVAFKKTEMMDLSKLSQEILRHFFEEHIMRFSDYIDFCSIDEQHREELRKQVISMILRFGRYPPPEDTRHIDFLFMEHFDEFVEKTFSTRRASKQFFTKCVLAYEEDFFKDVVDSDKFVADGCDLLKFASYFSFDLFSAENKSDFLELYESQLMLHGVLNFDIELWNDLVTECATDDEHIAQFKQSLRIDTIFDKTLRKYIFLPSPQTGYRYTPLQDFILWYFDGCQEAVREFKLNRLQHNREYLQLPRSKPVTDGAVDELCMWLCEGDIEQIEKFKSGFGSLSTEHA